MSCKGGITREYTVWCMDCAQWEQCGTEPKRKDAEKFFKRPNGWRKGRDGKWRCLDCHQAKEKS